MKPLDKKILDVLGAKEALALQAKRKQDAQTTLENISSAQKDAEAVLLTAYADFAQPFIQDAYRVEFGIAGSELKAEKGKEDYISFTLYTNKKFDLSGDDEKEVDGIAISPETGFIPYDSTEKTYFKLRIPKTLFGGEATEN